MKTATLSKKQYMHHPQWISVDYQKWVVQWARAINQNQDVAWSKPNEHLTRIRNPTLLQCSQWPPAGKSNKGRKSEITRMIVSSSNWKILKTSGSRRIFVFSRSYKTLTLNFYIFKMKIVVKNIQNQIYVLSRSDSKIAHKLDVAMVHFV